MNEPAPAHFAIVPAKPKGTIEDWKAGNLEPAKQEDEPVVRQRRRVQKKQPDYPKGTGMAHVAESVGPDPQSSELSPVEVVMRDLLRKRDEINAAIRALEALYS